MWSYFDHTLVTTCWVVLANTGSPRPVQRFRPTHTPGIVLTQVQARTDADLRSAEVDHATPPGRSAGEDGVPGHTGVVLGSLVGPGADVGTLDAVEDANVAPAFATLIVDVAGPASVAGARPAHLQQAVAADVLRSDGLGVVGASGGARVESDAAAPVAVVGGTGARRTDRDGSRDECDGEECSSYDFHVKPALLSTVRALLYHIEQWQPA